MPHMRQPATPKVLTRGHPDSRSMPHSRLHVKQPQLTPRNMQPPTRTVRDPSNTAFANTFRQETVVGKSQRKGTIFQELSMKFDPSAKAGMQGGEITYSPPGESFMEKHRPHKVHGHPSVKIIKGTQKVGSGLSRELKMAKAEAKRAPGKLKGSASNIKEGSEYVGKKGKSGKEKLEAVMTKQLYSDEYKKVKSLYPNLSDEEAAQMVLDTHHEVEAYKERKMQEDIKDINAEAELRKIESKEPVIRTTTPKGIPPETHPYEPQKVMRGEAKSITSKLHFKKHKPKKVKP